MDRRQFLQTLAAAAGSAVVAGCSSDGASDTTTDRPTTTTTDTETRARTQTETATTTTTTATTTTTTTTTTTVSVPSEYAGQFETVVDVTDAGADPGGETPVDDVLSRVAADNTLLLFPPGTYRVDTLELSGYRALGLVAETTHQASIVPNQPGKAINNLFLRFLSMEDFLFDGIDLDFREDRHGGATQVYGRGDFTVRDIRLRGEIPDRHHPKNPAAFRFDVRDEGSTGRIERVVAKDGGHSGGNAVGTYVGKDHAGELVFSECELHNFPNNGLYASAPGRTLENFHGADGVVHVNDGVYKNNNIANVRLGSTGSTVKDTQVLMDEMPPDNADHAVNVRGIRLRGQEGQVIENCEVTLSDSGGTGFGGVVIHPDNGRATIRNSTIRVDRDGIHGINALRARGDSSPAGPILENVDITGTASHGRAVAVKERDGAVIRDCRISHPGEERSGALFVDSEDGLVANTTIDVTGEPIETVGSTVQQRNVTVK